MEETMTTRNEIEEAIQLMQEMGIGRKQAVKALSRYNYDVGRAADYIFSGNAESDGEDSSSSSSSSRRGDDSTTPMQLNPWEYEDDRKLTDSSENISIAQSENQQQQQQQAYLVKDYDKKRLSDTFTSYDPAMWSIVPASTTQQDSSAPLLPPRQSVQSSVTWWVDPSNPSERIAKDNISIGLRPPPYDYAYVPVILQTLFSITFFQDAVFAFRPTTDNWGSPLGYWRGEGEAVPTLLSHTATTAITPTPTPPPPSYSSTSDTEDLGDDDDILKEPNDVVHIPISDSVRALMELQKIFAYLRYSKRQYGNVCNFVRAMKTMQTGYQSWDASEPTVDGFFDSLMGMFAKADEHREPNLPKESLQRLYNLFLLKAKDNYGSEVDEQELLYLNLHYDENARRFHDCLGPMVYDYHRDTGSNNSVCEPTNDDTSQHTLSSADDNDWRLTTFERAPPILIVILENNMEESKGSTSNYLVDKTIYLDRYMDENKDEALKRYQQAYQWRQDIRKARIEIAEMGISNCQSSSSITTTTLDKRDILTKTMDYFGDKSDSDTTAPIHALQKLLASVKQKITQRLEELYDIEKSCQEQLNTLFETPDFQKKPYDVRALLYHDGGNGPGHYWGYIWMEQANLRHEEDTQGRWFQFCDAIVTPVTEDEVFNESTAPLAVIYADRAMESPTREDLDNHVPDTLKEFVLKDNENLEESIREYDQGNSTSNSSNTSYDGDAQEISIPDSKFTYRGGECVVAPISDDLPEIDYQPVSEDDDELRKYMNTLLTASQTYPADDYHIMKNFESFLAKNQDYQALETYVYTYADSQVDNVPTFLENESRQDPVLVPLWAEYDTFLKIARIVVNALAAFINAAYLNSLSWLLRAKREEATWKEHLLLETDLINAQSRLQSLGFERLIFTYGKACIKQLDEAAYKKACSAAYCTRGLHEATMLVHNAQTIIGPDRLVGDELFNDMRERWLKFGETTSLTLQQNQADLLNTLIMAFLEPEYQTAAAEEGLATSLDTGTFTEHSFDGPLWSEYKRLCEEAKNAL
ncbi:hypothetical protein RO3G_15853 [Lichtheimia corymbifera JMRC:FSU:9682]|uniref:UBA domain-containing protein n=1 Tax=Lichtheimia corymbifera JMRC:FSU:9682 TaxID=1263082 RepID=A0A068RXV1_9FUNG|nr:hypothetical protein RO3G_15853 [Lichtheimia corymbifera JMRC:FSU:9682]